MSEEWNCNVEAVKEISKTSSRVILVAVTPECPNGAMMKQLVRETLPEFEKSKVTVAELEGDTNKCRGLLSELKIQACPTVVFYKNGREAKRFTPNGESREEVKALLLSFAEKGGKKEGESAPSESTKLEPLL